MGSIRLDCPTYSGAADVISALRIGLVLVFALSMRSKGVLLTLAKY